MSYKTKVRINNKLLYKIITNHFPNNHLSSITEIEGSFVNPVFAFSLNDNTSYILKFNNPRWPFKQEREINALKLVQERTSIPVPKVIVDHSSANENDLVYMILEQAPGKEFREVIANNLLTEKEIITTIEKIAFYLSELHTINFDFFGDISGLHVEASRDSFFWGKRFASWPECFRAFCMDILNWVDKESFPKLRPSIIRKIDTYTLNQPNLMKASFIHSDIQPSNILIHEKEISALIDFEWAFAGSPGFEYSLTRAGFYFSVFPSLEFSSMYSDYSNLTKETIDKAFLRGYTKSHKLPIPKMEDDLTDFIWLLYMIGSWDWTVQSSTYETKQKYKQDILNLYKKLIS